MPERVRAENSPPSRAGKSSFASRLPWLARLLLGLAILLAVFHFVPFAEVMDALAAARPIPLLAALGILFFERLVAARRNVILNEQVGIRLSVWRVYEIGLASAFYGMFLPGDLAGGAVRWYKLSQPQGRRAQALASVTFERLLDTLILLALGLAFLILAPPSKLGAPIALGFLAGLAALALVVALSLSRGVSSGLLALLARQRGHRVGEVAHDKARKVLESVGSYRRLSTADVLGLVGLTLLRHLLSTAMLFAFSRALGLEVGFAALAWVRALLNVATMIPLTFSGLGVREAGMVLLLEPYGVAGASAVALSFLQFLVGVVLAATGGLLEVKQLVGSGARKDARTG